MKTVTITKTDFNLDLLTQQLDVLLNDFYITTLQTQITVHYNDDVLEQDIINIVNTHSYNSQILKVVQKAIKFGNDLIISFATENVIMGITQTGKTKAVADYLADMMRYAQSGSLYEVMAEVDRLIASGIPQELAPFVTEARLTQFKQKVLAYLNG